VDYEPTGMLSRMTVGGGITAYLYDGADLVAVYDANGAVLARYVHGAGLDEPLVIYAGAGTGNKTWLHADERGSIVATSDSSGVATATAKYSSDGEGGGISVFGYTGQLYLSQLQLYYYKARMYSPKTARFLQPDPIGYSDGMNLFAYVGNDPINGRDPFGLQEGDLSWCAHLTGGSCPAVSADVINVIGQGCNWLCRQEAQAEMYARLMEEQIARARDMVSEAVNSTAFSYVTEGIGWLLIAVDVADTWTVVGAGPDAGLAGAPMIASARALRAQIHHIATNKAIKSGFTEQFQRIFGRAGKSLEDPANKLLLEGHAGRHSPLYHQHVLDRLQNATRGLSGDAYTRALDAELGALRSDLLKNPDLVRGIGL
jgi:RHS repeat-associated protein